MDKAEIVIGILVLLQVVGQGFFTTIIWFLNRDKHKAAVTASYVDSTSKLTDSVMTLGEQVVRLIDTVNKRDEIIDRQQSENRQQKEDILSLQASVDYLKGKLRKAEQESEKLRSALGRLQDDLKGREGEIMQLRERITALEASERKAVTEGQEKDRMIATLTTQVEELKKQIVELRAQYEALDEKYQASERERKALKGRLEGTQSEVGEDIKAHNRESEPDEAPIKVVPGGEPGEGAGASEETIVLPHNA